MSIHENSEQRTLAFLKTGRYSSIEISKAVRIRDNTSIKDVKHLRDKLINIRSEWREKDGVRWKVFWWEPGVYKGDTEQPPAINFGSCPNPHCGVSGFYSSPASRENWNKRRCSACGTIYEIKK